jgi:uncharacterized membrane protein
VESVSFDFEPWDLTEYVWPLIGLLLVVEWLRWTWKGRGVQRGLRFFGGGAALGALTSSFVRWGLYRDARTMTLAVAILGVLAMVWAARSYRWTTRPLGRREKIFLLSLRCIAVVGVLLVLARPVLRWTRLVEDRGTIAMLFDDSRSMRIRDVAAGPQTPRSRLEQLDAFLHDNRIALERIRRTHDVQTFAFDASLRVCEPEQLTAKGPSTALATAVREAFQRTAGDGRRLVGVMLMTDGGDNFSAVDPLAVAGELAQAGVPVWAVGFGSELPAGQTRSLTARRLTAPARVAVLNRLAARAELLALGLAGRPVQAELLFDDKVVDSKTLQPAQARETITADFSYTPIEAGLHKLTIRATANDLAPDRRTVTLSQFVHVTKDYIQVLYVDRPRYERAAIARSLESAKELRLMKAQVGKAGGRIVNRLPRRPEEWHAFDAFILGDVTLREIYPTQLEIIRDAVRDHGRGLLVIAGERGLGSGAFADTALADVLPMAASSKGELRGPIPLKPTSAGLPHPICRLAPTVEETQRLWSLVPPAPAVSLLQSPKPAALTLLAGPAGQPILLTQEVGTGRAAVLAIDSTWEWPMKMEQGREVHARFWRQLILWLANRQPGVWVTTNQPRYLLARLASGTDTVIVEAGVEVFGADSTPHNVELAGEVKGGDGAAQAMTFVRRNDRYEARPTVSKEGEYQIEVKATVDGVPAEPARTAFVVESPDIEMQDATANFELLRQMTARTAVAGGMFVTADHAADLLDHVLSGEHTVRHSVASATNLMDRTRWPVLAVVIGALALEWIVRKRRGLT